jgi:hypothetical protein
MKRILSVLLIAGFTFGATAQEKKIRGGLVTGFTLNTLSTNTTKIERNGTGAGFVIGMTGEYNVNQNIAFSGSVEFSMESFKVNYGSNLADTKLSPVFYSFNDTEIIKISDVTDTDTVAFQVLTRKFRAKYVTIPLFMKFQTNMIGDFKYYGKMGLRTSFLAGVRMDDEGFESKKTGESFERTATNTMTIEDMKPESIKKGLSPIKMGIGVYGGAEWNFTGNTNLYAEAGFVYGVTPSLWQKSGHLNETDAVNANGVYTTKEPLDVKNNPMHTFELKVGLLF